MVFLVTTGFRACPGWVIFAAALQVIGACAFGFLPYGLRLFTDGVVAHDKGELVIAAIMAGGLFMLGWITGFLGTTTGFLVAGRSNLLHKYPDRRTREQEPGPGAFRAA
jgi:hypothetical protein